MALIVAYAKAGDMVAACELFDRFPVKDVVAWTTIVTGFAHNAQQKEALEHFEKMQNARVNMDEVTLSSVISAFTQLVATKYAFGCSKKKKYAYGVQDLDLQIMFLLGRH